MAKTKAMTLDQSFAVALCETHEVAGMMLDSEERNLLIENNSTLYYAYVRLLQIAYPDDGRWLL